MKDQWLKNGNKINWNCEKDRIGSRITQHKWKERISLTQHLRSGLGFTSNKIMFLTEHKIRVSIKSSWFVVHNMTLSVRMDKKLTHSFVCFLYYHPNLKVSQSFQFRETRLQPSAPWQPLQCIKLFISDLQQWCWQRGLATAAKMEQHKDSAAEK